MSLVGILTAGVISYAWVEPSDSPPSGNVSGIFGLLREDGSLVIDGDIRAKDFLVNYTNESGTSVSKSITELVDKDNDGYTAREGDCDDGNADIYPGAAPRYDSGKDYDCSGTNEYTIDHYSNVYAPTACTKGGNFVNFQGYVYGYKCIEKVHTNMGYECKDNVYHSNEELVYTMYNNKSKYHLCLYENHYSNDSALVMGTSGGNY
ncbi:MAG: putative metal-binding motif-containing protein, partial [Nanoarchaeota archaeon]|nr:putative metal-binding motif-containing protein [Nanoarchaeota archaeon]